MPKTAKLRININSKKKLHALAKERIEKWIAMDKKREILDLSDLQLDALPKLPENLQALDCTKNNLIVIHNLPKELKQLFCDNNDIKEFPSLLPPDLDILSCNNNNLSELPDLPKRLSHLECNHNDLTTLSMLPDTLIELECKHNDLPSSYNKQHGESMKDYILRIRELIKTSNDSLNFSNPLNVDENNATNYVTFENIGDEDRLVNLPRIVEDNELKFNSHKKKYLKYNTYLKIYDRLKNPHTNLSFKRKKVRFHTAKIKKKH
jgi:hypothetical protein